MPIDFDFLTWFERACFFRDDAQKEMEALGVDPITAYTLTRCDAFASKHSIVAMYQDYGRIDDNCKAALDKWVAFNYTKYLAIVEREPR